MFTFVINYNFQITFMIVDIFTRNIANIFCIFMIFIDEVMEQQRFRSLIRMVGLEA